MPVATLRDRNPDISAITECTRQIQSKQITSKVNVLIQVNLIKIPSAGSHQLLAFGPEQLASLGETEV